MTWRSGPSLLERSRWRAYDEALSWMNRALLRYPGAELLAERIRILAWAGRLKEAWRGVERLPPSAFDDADTQRLAANVALWSGHYRDAEQRYTPLSHDYRAMPAH